MDISSMKEKSLGGSKFLALIVDDNSDYIWGRFFNKKLDLSDNVMPILKKLFMQGKEVKYIRCDNVGRSRRISIWFCS